MSAPDRSAVLRRVTLLIAGAVCGAVAWILVTRWNAVLHGHPAYAALLGLTVVVTLVWVVRWQGRPARSRWRRVLRVVVAVAAVCWLAALAWLRPFPAGPTALAAMASSPSVVVEESPTRILLRPTGNRPVAGVFFQPGARVDARAYAAHARPLADAGYLVVIAKQPLGIAFLAMSAFDQTRRAHPEIDQWFVAGHSLGGTVAALEVDNDDHGATPGVAGLVLWASYPAGDESWLPATTRVASISGSRDGLSTPADIAASRANLPATTAFTVIEGASHDQFGDYGSQAGAGTPTISADQARREIAAATLAFVERAGGPTTTG